MLIVEIVLLLSNALIISRDYQDSWILEGLEIPFVLFVTTYALAFFSEKRLSWMVALAVIGRCVFLLIPNLKYVWFQGVWVDQQAQYGLANTVLMKGHIATQNIFNVQVYGTTPFIHLNFAIFSIVLGAPVVDSVKYIPVLLSSLFPLLTYVIMKNLKFLHGTTATKYALFVSSIPISGFTGYLVSGQLFGVLLSFLILTSLIMLLEKKDRLHWAIFIFLIFVLSATHSSSSVLLTALLSIIMLLQQVSYFRLKSYLNVAGVFAVMSICAAWLMLQAKVTFGAITRRIFVELPMGTASAVGSIPPRFFEIARVDILGAIDVILLNYGAQIFLMLLTIGGLIVMLKMRKRLDNTAKFLFIITGLLVLLVPVGFAFRASGVRFLSFATPFFPIFCAIFILYACKTRVWLRAVIFSSIILLATLQLYTCQPLVPSANVLSKDLPASEPIQYINEVNSIYQRQMIEFAENYVSGRIASDSVTENQMIGLTEFDFYAAHVASRYPLDKNQPETTYDYFLIHVPGISGVFGEQAEIRTRDLILEAIYNSSVIYTNGESFILAHT